MYVVKERFKNNSDKHADGTVAFICDKSLGFVMDTDIDCRAFSKYCIV